VVHPNADAGVVSTTAKEAKAAAARMSFFIIGSPVVRLEWSIRCGEPVTMAAQ